MREIKFRGKVVEHLVGDSQWIIGFGVFTPDRVDDVQESWLYSTYGVCQVDPKTVGQYTGMKDKNGVEIFEGDISKQTYHTEARDDQGEWFSFDGHHVGEVVITPRGVCMKNPLHYSMETDETHRVKMYKQVVRYRSEVIGNIHDHPHLLTNN